MQAPVRNLIACPRCARQFDVGALEFGECVRCLCGETLRWLERPAHEPQLRRCPHCGAACPAEAGACSYCKSEIQLEDRGLAEVCPGCYARLLRGAHFCMECGIAIQPQALHALPVELACPRCKAQLRRRTLGKSDVIECASCAGLWLTQETVQRLVEHAEETEFESLAPAPAVVRSEGYIPCVVCAQLMQRRNFGGSSGVIVDVCAHHGIWFDHRELERVLQFVRSGGLRRAREREIEHQEARLRRLREPAPLVSGLEERREPDWIDMLGSAGSLLSDLLRRT